MNQFTEMEKYLLSQPVSEDKDDDAFFIDTFMLRGKVRKNKITLDNLFTNDEKVVRDIIDGIILKFEYIFKTKYNDIIENRLTTSSSLDLTLSNFYKNKPSIHDPNYKPNILTTDDFGNDVSSKEGADLILAQEDSDYLVKARINEKRRLARIIARGEAKYGMLPMSNSFKKNLEVVKLAEEYEQKKKEKDKDNKYAMKLTINFDKKIDYTKIDKMLKKTWIVLDYIFIEKDDHYILSVPFEYQTKKGTCSRKTISMAKKEIVSTLKITRNDIIGESISRNEYNILNEGTRKDNIICLEVD